MDACKKHMTFQERELSILREAIDKADEERSRKLVNTPEIKRMIEIVERFLRSKKLICYGGTAINNILPVSERFYDYNLQIPDYDFFSKSAMDDAKELADIYAKEGFANVQAKAGQHFGTYKVFVDFTPIADVTQLDHKIFNNLWKSSVRVNGIHYAPPDYLRMGMYLELSRPAGDVSRWEKMLKRLILLNKNYPMKTGVCQNYDILQRDYSEGNANEEKLYNITQESLIHQGVVFFGGFAGFMFSKFMPKKVRKQFSKSPDFDVLSKNPKETATILKESIEYADFKNVKVIKHDGIGEVIPKHYEVRVGKDTVAFIYEPLACHSYNTIKVRGTTVKIATIDTILSLYLAFLYAGKAYYEPERIMCMAALLFDVQKRNRLSQKGILKRFPIECYGRQETIESIRAEKAEKFEELKNKKNSREYEMWFLNYQPESKEKRNTKGKVKKTSKRRKSTKGGRIRNRTIKHSTRKRVIRKYK